MVTCGASRNYSLPRRGEKHDSGRVGVGGVQGGRGFNIPYIFEFIQLSVGYGRGRGCEGEGGVWVCGAVECVVTVVQKIDEKY